MTGLTPASDGKVWTPESERAAAIAGFEKSKTYARVVLYFSLIFLLTGLVFLAFSNPLGHAEGDIWVRSNIGMLIRPLFFAGFAGVLASTLFRSKSLLTAIASVVVGVGSVGVFCFLLVTGIINYSPSVYWVAQQAFGSDSSSWTWTADDGNQWGKGQTTFSNEAGETRTVSFIDVDESGVQGVKVELQPKSDADVAGQTKVG